MAVAEGTEKSLCAIYVDMGTTNSHLWLMLGERVLASTNASVGVRDGSARVRASLRESIAEVGASAPGAARYVAAAGMIGSSLGLVEVPHLRPPVGVRELIAGARWHHFSDVTELPVLLIPGVRSGDEQPTVESVFDTDVMRGEETLCAGLFALGLVAPPCIVLNLGSHWKAIELDRDGRIQSSITSLSGELIHAAQLHTILASSVSSEKPQQLAQSWIDAGMKEQRRSGLGRAAFAVRLLDLAEQGTKEDRLAFLIGAFIASDVDGLLSRGMLRSDLNVAVVGSAAIAETWRSALTESEIPARVISMAEAEKALLTASRLILVESCHTTAAKSLNRRTSSS
ncbi:MAG: 2-dehydro-3-deoxygalactonokinase [Terriglobales bacterium]